MRNTTPLALLLALFLGLLSCKKAIVEKDGDSFRISMLPLPEVEFNTFRVKGTLDVRNVNGEIQYGLLVGKSVNPTIENATHILLGKANASVDFTKELNGLDTGTVYYVRAYGKIGDMIEYSANQQISKVSPQIKMPDSTLNYGRNFTFSTNITAIGENAKIQLTLNGLPVAIKSIASTSLGLVFTAEPPNNLIDGEVSLNLIVDNISIRYSKKLNLLSGMWKDLPDLPFENYGFAYNAEKILVGDWIYNNMIISGTATEFSKFNYKTGQRVKLTPLAGGFVYQKGAIISIGDQIHFICGERAGNYQSWVVTKVHYVYNISTDSWIKEADFPGEERRTPVFGVIGNKIYVGLGVNSGTISMPKNTFHQDMWSYDPSTKVWQKLTDFPDAGGRMLQANFVIGSKLYFTAGVAKSGNQNISSKDTWGYDVASNQWAKKAPFPGKAEVLFANFTIGGYGYVGMGESMGYNSYNGKNLENAMYRYEPNANRWQRVSNGYQLVSDPFSASNGSIGLIGGGTDANSDYTPQLYYFTP
ncbi:hypothetical protein G7074_16335 [Pedobacter sp. HDW13]|uniref:Kelch repeat-containing protein n=1 Tax=Pedobacter sp. HDW13 TaxID=2714940 RepID=UPI00140B4A57|nr:hypothetical protein [Pedobacter sp. HDW13]QIL40695.1 hypothetical protein G7074_16335 [Pedobacter sp. HDW13]